MQTTFFKDLLVVELASVLAGPSVGVFFAEMGAKVIKIENPKTNGDVTRSWKLPNENTPDNLSAYYASVNYGKTVEMLDVTNPIDYQRVVEFLKKADIVIVNYKAGDDVKLKLDYNSIKALNPKIIYAQITGFGKNDKRTAFDVVLQAEAGYMYMNGSPESLPLKMPVALIDVLAAHQLKEGVLVALLQREKTGKGALVTVSLFDAAVASLVNQATNWLVAQQIPQRMGSLHPNIAPYGEIFETKDKQLIVLAIGNDKQFQSLCQILDLQTIATSPLYQNNTARVKNRKTLADILAQSIQEKESQWLLTQAIEKDIPMGAIKNMQQVFETPQAKALTLTYPKHHFLKTVKSVVFNIDYN